MKRKKEIENGRIALTLTPKGIDTVSFLSSDKSEALTFYLMIEKELKQLESRIQALSYKGEGVGFDG